MQENQTKRDQMLTAAPPRLILSLAAPATAALLISAGCGILDAWFVSRLGTSAGGAVGIVFAVTSLIQAIGYTLGTGAASLISRALGANDRESARFFASLSFFLALAAGGAITLAGVLTPGRIIRFLGASDGIYPYARAYATYLFPAAPLMCGSFVLSNLLRAEGQVRCATLGTSAGSLVGVALAPLFLFRFRMGIAGASLALLLSQAVSFVWLLLRYLTGKTRVSLLPCRAPHPFRGLRSLLLIGSPSLFRQGLAGVASALLLRQAKRFGDASAAAISVNARIFLLLYSFCLGVGQGMMPAVGFNRGANRPDRVLSLARFSLILATALMFALSVPTAILAPRIIGLFRPDPEVIRPGAFLLRAQCAVFALHGIIAVTNMLLQALGKTVPAVLIAAARQGFCFLPAVLLLPRILGLDGLCLCQAAADVLTFLLTLPFLIVTLRNLRDETRQHPQKLLRGCRKDQ